MTESILDDRLIVELKAAKALADEHIAQLLGYLRASRVEHGLLMNFGAAKFEIRKFVLSQAGGEPRGGTPANAVLVLIFFFASFAPFRG